MTVSPTINSVHGRVFFHAPSDPAAGANLLATVPDRRRWRILGIRFTFTTDATVTDRQVILVIDDGATNIHASNASAVQTASLIYHYNFSDTSVAPYFSDPQFNNPLAPFILPAGARIRSSITNIQAGDDISTPLLLIEEWIDP